MASTSMPRDHLSSRPPELKLEIFRHLPTASSVHNLSVASKVFRRFLDEHHDSIVRSLANKIVKPECVKLAVMAIESRAVNPDDGKSVQQFIDTYMNHDKLTKQQLCLRVVDRMPALHHAILSAIDLGFPTAVDLSPRDQKLVLQSHYVLETFSNLYNSFKSLATTKEIGFRFVYHPNYPWPAQFWAHFSQSELEVVCKVGQLLYEHGTRIKDYLLFVA
ncbi:uncharacterized protein PG986_013078 [Apiospora aurea]|uniref:F-box domain-containing protein n=1 Tax=Apiospora aurea TaxID=335848 RepID=A0ABR1Q1U7_9PEZI